MTKKQADWMKERMETRQEDQFPGEIEDKEALTDLIKQVTTEMLAEELGLSVEEVEKKLEDGMSLPKVAREGDLDRSDLRGLLQDARDSALDQALEQGLLTEEQADWLREHLGRIAKNRLHDFRARQHPAKQPAFPFLRFLLP